MTRKSFTLSCTKHGGKLKIFDRMLFDQQFAQFGEGEDLNLTIEEVARTRTLAQNRFFHGPVLAAFAELGYRKQEAKDMLCLHFIPQDVRDIDGLVVRVPGHTATLSVHEFNDLIDSCIQLAAENGVVVQDGEAWRLAHRGATAQWR